MIMDDSDRAFLRRMIDDAKPGTLSRDARDPTSDAQKNKMQAMLGEVAKQIPHVEHGRSSERFYAPEQWKLLFMHACGQEVEMMPSLDGSTFLPTMVSSSKR